MRPLVLATDAYSRVELHERNEFVRVCLIDSHNQPETTHYDSLTVVQARELHGWLDYFLMLHEPMHQGSGVAGG